jgi:tRNA-modifying protein YgfZ
MNTDWKQFLQEQTIAPPLQSIELTENDGGNIICDLSNYDTLVVAGGDAASFMQGQFTNDVNDVDAGHSQLDAVCNNKGRMIANFRLFNYQQNYFISIDNSLSQKTIDHLGTYILRAEVAIQDVSEQLIHLGVSGDDAEKRLKPFLGELPQDVDSVSSNEDYIAIRVAGSRPGGRPRYEIFCQLEQAKKLWQSLADQGNAASPDSWNYLNIKAGLPFIDANTSEAFVPQMANMDLINGVSFTKGCFTGQEIIARTHYLGKQKRRCYRLKIDTDRQPDHRPGPGEQLRTPTSTENQYTGTLVNVVKTAENSYEALAVIQIKDAEQGDLQLRESDGGISLLELPYSLETTDEPG